MIQLRDAALGPVLADHGKYLTEDVALGNGAVDVGDDDLVAELPLVDVRATAFRSLILGRHAEGDRVGAGFQLELFLLSSWE